MMADATIRSLHSCSRCRRQDSSSAIVGQSAVLERVRNFARQGGGRRRPRPIEAGRGGAFSGLAAGRGRAGIEPVSALPLRGMTDHSVTQRPLPGRMPPIAPRLAAPRRRKLEAARSGVAMSATAITTNRTVGPRTPMSGRLSLAANQMKNHYVNKLVSFGGIVAGKTARDRAWRVAALLSLRS